MSSCLPTSPEWNALLQKRDALYSQIATVLAEIHSLADSSPVVIGHYAAAFGERLTRLHAAEIDAARLKREIELVQAAINSGQDFDYEKIQEILDAEFAEWQAKLNAEAENLKRERGVLDHLLDPEKTVALRDRFRVLARRLHPDLNPSQSLAAAELWHRVTAAYAARDLAELDAIEILTRDSDTQSPPESTDALRGVIEILRAQLEQLLTTMAQRRNSWPFDQLRMLEDPDATAAQQAELDSRIDQAEALREDRKQWLNQLLGR
jgi:hypothetical protein